MLPEYNDVKWAEALEQVSTELVTLLGYEPLGIEAAAAKSKLMLQWIEAQNSKHPVYRLFGVECASPATRLCCHVSKLLQPQLAYHIMTVPQDGCTITAMQATLAVFPLYDAIALVDALPNAPHRPDSFLRLFAAALSMNGVLYLSLPDAVATGRIYHTVTGWKELELTGDSNKVIEASPRWQYCRDEVEEIVQLAQLSIQRFGYVMTPVGRYMNFAITR